MPAILYQDDDIIAVDKPAGLATIPERDKTKDSVLSQLQSVAGFQPAIRGRDALDTPHKVYVVHRLDKYASGVVIFAKNARTHKHLCRQFAGHTVNKTYLVLTHGHILPDSDVIDKPIRRFGSGRVAVGCQAGKPSVTRFEVVRRFDNFTLLRAYPVTGRQHQLRVHFYSIGHPIVGDLLYGQKNLQTSLGAKRFDSRLMLHAERISFSLPSGEDLTIESPLPDSFTQVLELLLRRQVIY